MFPTENLHFFTSCDMLITRRSLPHIFTCLFLSLHPYVYILSFTSKSVHRRPPPPIQRIRNHVSLLILNIHICMSLLLHPNSQVLTIADHRFPSLKTSHTKNQAFCFFFLFFKDLFMQQEDSSLHGFLFP
eukprot:TRINITY_DN16223_c0_g1_i3.p1 TRINITY_DN16223_c0_g1~~TRINITY_DN16223_c0_g1_i3.p1  ORF type:complete len:130 (-),score=7.81 TRINITY_DN16223_c0_g1_i3:444-833(-)